MVKNIIIVVLLVVSGYVGVLYLTSKKTKTEELETKGYAATVYKKDTSTKGYLLISTGTEEVSNAMYNQGKRSEGSFMITDLVGNTIVKRDFKGGMGDFRQWKFGDQVYYTYSYSSDDVFRSKKVKKRLTSGPYHVLDSALNEVGIVHLLPFGDVTTKRREDLDFHDIVMMGKDHFITMASYEKTPGNIPTSLQAPANKSILTCIIQEVVNNKVVWQWDASMFPEFYEHCIHKGEFKDDLAFDYLHPNALTVDPKDSNIIVSFWGLNQLVKIQRYTGKIIWRLGGEGSDFPITEDQYFFGQHACTFKEDKETLLILDNGEPNIRPYSRVIEFKLDEQNKKITSFYTYKIPHNFTDRRGNVTPVGDKYLICGGFAKFIILIDPKTDHYLYHVRINSNYKYYRAFLRTTFTDLKKEKIFSVR